MRPRDRARHQPIWRRYLRLRGADPARDVQEELSFHLEMLVEENVARGMTPEEARRAALRRFGDAVAVERECVALSEERDRSILRGEALDALVQDVRYGVRQLLRQKLFAAVAVLTLALGIGANTAVFSAVWAVLLRPLPYAGADRIVLLSEAERTNPQPGGTTSWLNVEDWRAQSRTLESTAILDEWQPALTGLGEPRVLKAALVTAAVFDVLRVRPGLGRPMLPADNATGAERVAVLSDGFWRRELGADPDAVGRAITLNGRPFTVVGVLPRGFEGPGLLRAELWANDTFDPADTRGSRYLFAMGRLRPGVRLRTARSELAAIAARLERAYPGSNKGMTTLVTPLRDGLAGDARLPLLTLLGASVLVLLIVCANLSNLLLARATAREREISVRLALGAGRLRLVRQLLTESALLVGAGAAVGVALAAGIVRVLRHVAPEGLHAEEIALDARVLLFALAVTLLTVLLVGLVPALRAPRVDVQRLLRESTRGNTGGVAGGRVRRFLVVGQLALALTLLGGTGLLIRSLVQLQRVDPGIRPERVLALSINLPAARYPDGTEPAFFSQLLERTGAIPGVRAAAATSILPFGGDWDRIAIDVAGRPPVQGIQKPEADRYIVSPGYFATLGIPLRAGRLFDERDAYDHPLVAVVDEVFARRLAPDGRAIGLRARLPGRDSLATIVGIVGHVKHYGLDRESGGQIYMSEVQYPWRWMNLVVRSSGAPLRLAPAVRRAVWSLDPSQPVFGVTSMESLMADREAVRRFVLLLLGAFAGFALLLAALGLYGVIAYGVIRRRVEIGIRLALGATPADVSRMVLREGVGLALVGCALGIVGLWAGGRLLRHLLFRVGAHDPLVLGCVVAFLLLVALSASYLPAHRASRTSPMESLRSE